MVDRDAGPPGLPICGTGALFYPQHSHHSGYRHMIIDASGKYYSGKTEHVLAKYAGTEGDNVIHRECDGFISSSTNF